MRGLLAGRCAHASLHALPPTPTSRMPACQPAGRVLINAPLVKGMKPTVNAKAAAALVMFLISRVDPSGPEERAMHMFRCVQQLASRRSSWQ